MGGPGSGRKNGRPTVETCSGIFLPVARLIGPARDSGTAILAAEWANAEGDNIQMTIATHLPPSENPRLEIHHAEFRLGGCPTRAASYSIALVPIRAGRSGVRWFATCPETGRRARGLWLLPGGAQFASRTAWGLAYRSQRIDPVRRSRDRANALHARREAAKARGARRPALRRLEGEAALAEFRAAGHFIRWARRRFGLPYGE